MRDGAISGRLKPASGTLGVRRSGRAQTDPEHACPEQFGWGRAFAMKILLRFFGFLFAAGTIVFLAGIATVAGLLWHYSKDLPDYSQLQNYEPPVMTRVQAADGSLVAEYANERRLYLPIQAIPKLVTNAFVAAEDKNFYSHPGIDVSGIARAALVYVQNIGGSRRPQGASTITQQVAKNFLLTNEVSVTRKIKEALLALRIERAYSKDRILELYLNQIYLGLGAYGIAAASLLYFDKSVHELTIAEAAYLAALPKGPNNYNPFRHRDEAMRGATMCSIAWSRMATSPRKLATRPARNRSTSRCGRPAPTPSRPSISPKKCDATFSKTTERRSFTRPDFRCAPRSTPRCRSWRARP